MKVLASLCFTIAALLTTACGKSGGTLNLTIDPPANNSTGNVDNNSNVKPLFSLWDEQSGLFKVDLRSLQFGMSSNATVTLPDLSTCTCKVLTQGSESSGTMTLSACSGSNANCGTTFNGTGNYTKPTSTTLQLCFSTAGCMSLR